MILFYEKHFFLGESRTPKMATPISHVNMGCPFFLGHLAGMQVGLGIIPVWNPGKLLPITVDDPDLDGPMVWLSYQASSWVPESRSLSMLAVAGWSWNPATSAGHDVSFCFPRASPQIIQMFWTTPPTSPSHYEWDGHQLYRMYRFSLIADSSSLRMRNCKCFTIYSMHCKGADD